MVYVTGKGRSGSTLLDALMGAAPGAVSVAELWHLWRLRPRDDTFCGCGEPLHECQFWTDVLQEAGLRADLPALEQVQAQLLRWPQVPQLLRAASTPQLDSLCDAYARLYSAIADVADATTVVDSSKFPAHPVALGKVPGVEVLSVQLVRDPRAVAWSNRRNKDFWDRPEGEREYAFGPMHVAASWVARNGAAELVGRRHARSFVVRYEDMVARPRAELGPVLEAAGLSPAHLPEHGEDGVELVASHTVGGNVSKFATGRVPLRLDDEWSSLQRPRDRRIVGALTWPLRRRYGY